MTRVEIERLVRQLIEICERGEWQKRHAAENTYCPYCAREGDTWEDQSKHHAGCKFVEIINQAKRFVGDIQ